MFLVLAVSIKVPVKKNLDDRIKFGHSNNILTFNLINVAVVQQLRD